LWPSFTKQGIFRIPHFLIQKLAIIPLLSVSDLMVPNINVWDKGKIESIFPMHIAKRILEIPLFSTVEDDTLV
jgi:hypothetical protein